VTVCPHCGSDDVVKTRENVKLDLRHEHADLNHKIHYFGHYNHTHPMQPSLLSVLAMAVVTGIVLYKNWDLNKRSKKLYNVFTCSQCKKTFYNDT